jgi:GGDEF domain-containing protein
MKRGRNGDTQQTVGLDDVTGVWNRAGFIAAAKPMFASGQRRAAPVALAYFDICATDATRPLPRDAAMQSMLLSMTRQMRKIFRESDIIGRVDTLRFAVLFADCDDAVLSAVEGLRHVPETSSPAERSLAVGLVRSASGMTLEDLMHAADVRTNEVRTDLVGA